MRKKRYGRKSLPKTLLKIGAGVLAIGGVAAIAGTVVDYVKDDYEVIHPSFEVGGLNEIGKYVEDESSIYTKNSFDCQGLKIVTDFDAEVKYQVFFYDDVDNFISSSDVYTQGNEFILPVGAEKARLELTPLNDDDGVISWFEKSQYANDIEINVYKNQNYLDSFVLAKKTLKVVSNTNDLVFTNGLTLDNEDGALVWNEIAHNAATSTTSLRVNGGEVFTVKCPDEFVANDDGMFRYSIAEFSNVPNDDTLISISALTSSATSFTLSEDTKYIVVTLSTFNPDVVFTEEQLQQIPSMFSLK